VKTGDCPSCRAPIEFAPGSGKVKVCEHCQTVVLRGEAKLESVGKVAELVDTDSPLKLGLSGKHAGVGFTVLGRIQKTHDTQAVYGAWDEWFLSFDDGRSAWLSESEGSWNLMFPLEGQRPPTWNDAIPGTDFQLKGLRFVVEERGKARTVSAQGQLPEFQPNHPFVDATGPKGVFVSVDYGAGESGEPFVGSTLGLDALGFDKSELSSSPRRQAMSQARCTECNGMLELRAPDLSRRVACPYCSALLDCSNGQLAFLQLLQKPALEPKIPLGRKGTLEGIGWTCIAFLIRSCEVERTRYEWEEYLLYDRSHGFRWLMQANGHWTFLTPIPAGEVHGAYKRADYAGAQYTLYQTVNTVTDYVVGECYWAVTQGERGWAAEYIAPPKSLNLDRTADEITFTAGTLLEAKTVKEAFKLTEMPPPSGMAPAQFNPWKERASSGWKWAGIWSAAMIALFIVFVAMSGSGTYLTQSFTVPPGAASASPEAMTFSEPFKVPAKTPLEVSVSTGGLSNQWVAAQTDLVNQDTFEVLSLNFELSEYHGSEDGESWSERDLSITKSTAEVDPGTYLMRVTPSFDATTRPTEPLAIAVKADPPGLCCPLMLVLLILCIPIYGSIRSSSFESTRWNDSVMQPVDYTGTAQAAATDDDDEDEEEDDE
jgi:LSD1 subclass zinc finger protein